MICNWLVNIMTCRIRREIIKMTSEVGRICMFKAITWNVNALHKKMKTLVALVILKIFFNIWETRTKYYKKIRQIAWNFNLRTMYYKEFVTISHRLEKHPIGPKSFPNYFWPDRSNTSIDLISITSSTLRFCTLFAKGELKSEEFEHKNGVNC